MDAHVRDSMACVHGTFVTGILAAKRTSPAPAICPDCTVLIRPIFADSTCGSEHMPSATPRELAAAIIECLDAGACVINLSLALEERSTSENAALQAALAQAVRRRVIVVGRRGQPGHPRQFHDHRHPWVIPVVACDDRRPPIPQSNLGRSIGRRGLTAPGKADHQSGARWTAHARRDERGRPVRDWRNRTAVVGISVRDPSRDQARNRLECPTVRRASVVPPSAGCRGGPPCVLDAHLRRR